MRFFGSITLYFMAFGVAGYAICVYALWPLGAVVSPDMRATYMEHPAGIYTHIFCSCVALILGPVQFSRRLRQTHQDLHRWLGRIYLGVGVLAGGVSGLYMSMLASGGAVAKLGFACLALAWLYTGGQALLAVRQGRISQHRRWMVLNFSLTLAAVTLRLYLPAALVAGVAFEAAYPAIAWLCWVPNLGAAILLCRTPLYSRIQDASL